MPTRVLLPILVAMAASAPCTQLPPQVADYSRWVGGSSSTNSGEWKESSEPGTRCRRFSHESISIELYDDGVFRSACNSARLAHKGARTHTTVTVKSEFQAYERAESILRRFGLWRPNLVREHCEMGPVTPSQAWTAGKVSLEFGDRFNGARFMEGGIIVDLDRFTGDLISVFADHPLQCPKPPVSFSEAEARSAAIQFVHESDAFTSAERHALSRGFKSRPIKGELVYCRDESSSAWVARPIYHFIVIEPDWARGVEVDANSGECSAGFASGSVPEQTIAERFSTPLGIGVATIIGVVIVFALYLRVSHITRTTDA